MKIFVIFGVNINPILKLGEHISTDKLVGIRYMAVPGEKGISSSFPIAPNTHYFYRAYVIVDDITYYSDTKEFTSLEAGEKYNIGDWWPNAENPEGIVTRIYGSPDVPGTASEIMNCLYHQDISYYDAAEWIEELGDGWSLTDNGFYNLGEYMFIHLNAGLEAKGFGRLPVEGYGWCVESAISYNLSTLKDISWDRMTDGSRSPRAYHFKFYSTKMADFYWVGAYDIGYKAYAIAVKHD